MIRENLLHSDPFREATFKEDAAAILAAGDEQAGREFVYFRGSLSDLKRKRDELKRAGARHALTVSALDRILETRGRAPVAPMPEDAEALMTEFRARFPHMEELAEELADALALGALDDDAPFHLETPLLLDGPPGVGKTFAAEWFASRLGVKFHTVSCADASNGFDLVGLSSGWGTGKPGLLARMFYEDGCPNPVIVLDEVDKIVADEKMSLEHVLYRLLEPETARNLRDEYLEVAVDASAISWIATSNERERIPAPILDRMTCIQVRAPSREERLIIVSSLYADMVSKRGWGRKFPPELDGDAAALLASRDDLSVRGMAKALRRAAGLAARRRKNDEEILAIGTDALSDALRSGAEAEGPGIGFL